MEWVLAAAALVALTIGVLRLRASRRNNSSQAAAVLSFMVSADLLVFAVVASMA